MGGLAIGSWIAYTIEFAGDQHNWFHHNHAGFIFLYIFIIIFTIVGLVGAVMDNGLIAAVYAALYTICIICDAVYIGAWWAYVIGQVCASMAVFYAMAAGGGGGGK